MEGPQIFRFFAIKSFSKSKVILFFLYDNVNSSEDFLFQVVSDWTYRPRYISIIA